MLQAGENTALYTRLGGGGLVSTRHSGSGGIDGNEPSVNDYLLSVYISAGGGSQVYDRPSHFNVAIIEGKSDSSGAADTVTHFPSLLAGIGTMPFAILSTGTPEGVISDAYGPGAMAFTRTGMFFSANSVAIILVRCDRAALALLYAN